MITFVVQDCIELIIGPLLYIYIKSIYFPPKHLIRQHLFHFIPLLIYFVFISIPSISSLIMDEYVFAYLEVIGEKYGFFRYLPHAIILLIYNILSLIYFKKYNQKIKLNYSSLDEKDLSWIKHFLIGLLVVVTINFLVSFYEAVVGELEWVLDYPTYYTLVAMIIYVGNYGIFQSRVLLPDFILAEENAPLITNSTSNSPTAPHHLSNASLEEINRLKDRLQEVLVNEKPYLNPDLTLGGLAKMISTTDKKLSALLNQKMEVSFYDLINIYRIEDVKSKMIHKNYEHYTLLALGLDSGFKSRTSFNRVFKKVTGQSPSAYRKAQLEKI
ncbi:MAG: helix-turn-helix domain-containing protein [Bacteroidota bacterium]